MKELRIVLAGNPNVGKSTVFNGLTGLHQHTGNWPGKTVEHKTGSFTQDNYSFQITDLPGTYSLDAHSPEEEAAADFLKAGLEDNADGRRIDCVAVVCDSSTLSRNLILVLQILSYTDHCVLCLNLMDEAARRGIRIDTQELSRILGCTVIPCTARQKKGLLPLCDAMIDTAEKGKSEPHSFTDYGESIAEQAEQIAEKVVCQSPEKAHRTETALDRIFLGKYTAYPMLALLVLAIFWLTVQGAGILSAGLELCFIRLLSLTETFLYFCRLPQGVVSFLTEGILASLLQVIAVMLPPMAVFFPLFTLLEDFGYLPRVAFLMDGMLSGCGACGKQALTMLMGLGCNAAGVTGCRIIDSPRERKLAMLTNCLIPCNGRLPTVLFLIAALSFSVSSRNSSGIIQAVFLLCVLGACTLATLGMCRLLSTTLLRGEPSSFTLELPAYRIPQVGQVLLRSLLDRTVLVLGRAAAIAAPAGAVLWILSHLYIGEISVFGHITSYLEPIGRFFGMDGVILTAFLFSLPAAELFLPLVLAGYTQGSAFFFGNTESASFLLPAAGWNDITFLCVLCFTLFHWPCSTTVWTIRKESGSIRWTLLAVLLPTALGFTLCACIHWGYTLLMYL